MWNSTTRHKIFEKATAFHENPVSSCSVSNFSIYISAELQPTHINENCTNKNVDSVWINKDAIRRNSHAGINECTVTGIFHLPNPMALGLTQPLIEMSKGKAIPLQALRGLAVSRSLRLLDFKTIGIWRWQCCQPYAPAVFTPRKYTWYSFLLEAESTPGP
jgi:hypothetical protein